MYFIFKFVALLGSLRGFLGVSRFFNPDTPHLFFIYPGTRRILYIPPSLRYFVLFIRNEPETIGQGDTLEPGGLPILEAVAFQRRMRRRPLFDSRQPGHIFTSSFYSSQISLLLIPFFPIFRNTSVNHSSVFSFFHTVLHISNRRRPKKILKCCWQAAKFTRSIVKDWSCKFWKPILSANDSLNTILYVFVKYSPFFFERNFLIAICMEMLTRAVESLLAQERRKVNTKFG